MNYGLSIINDFLLGVKDSLYLFISLVYVFKNTSNTKIITLLFYCLMINGAVVFGLFYIYNRIQFELIDNYILLIVISILYYSIILIPLFLISNILSSIWIDEIYIETLIVYEKTSKIVISGRGILTNIQNQIERLLIIISFIIQNLLLNLIPFRIVSSILCFFSMTIFHSIYVFEYILLQKYIKDYISILYFIEKKIFYFSGFGFIFTIIIYYFSDSFITSSAMFLIIFPFYLIVSVDLSKRRFDEFTQIINQHEKEDRYFFFSFIKYIYSNVLLKVLKNIFANRNK